MDLTTKVSKLNIEEFKLPESTEEYTFKATLVFWKFYQLGLHFDLPDVRRHLESEEENSKEEERNKGKI